MGEEVVFRFAPDRNLHRVSTLETAGNILRAWCLAVDDWIGQSVNNDKFQSWRTIGIWGSRFRVCQGPVAAGYCVGEEDPVCGCHINGRCLGVWQHIVPANAEDSENSNCIFHLQILFVFFL